MKNNKGLTLIEVLLALFLLITAVSILNTYCFLINRTTAKSVINQEIGILAKNKMEEVKSGYIYIDNNRYHILDLEEFIGFKEQNYDVNISISPLHDYENISRINLEVRDEKENISYNLIRYIDLRKIVAHK
ncbi:MAG TPA: prepilin-type N-terminal cleavage/methylation domain-containing protein [Clostridia bacterium]|nr:prepilin-type N-terminal cleavage/methylation domain-containing protein [Clostridia bacterium]